MITEIHRDAHRGLAFVDDHAAEVDLTSAREILVGPSGNRVLGDVRWSGQAVLHSPPSFDLLEFTGPVSVAVGERTSTAIVVDATPGSGILYLIGTGTPPFGACPPP